MNQKSASIERCRFWALACHLLMYCGSAAAIPNRTESHSQDATVQLPPEHELADLLATSTVAVDIKILYTDGCIRMPARRLVALQQAVKGRPNKVCLPFAEPELTTNNNTFEGPFSVTTPEVSCLVESVRY